MYVKRVRIPSLMIPIITTVPYDYYSSNIDISVLTRDERDHFSSPRVPFSPADQPAYNFWRQTALDRSRVQEKAAMSPLGTPFSQSTVVSQTRPQGKGQDDQTVQSQYSKWNLLNRTLVEKLPKRLDLGCR